MRHGKVTKWSAAKLHLPLNDAIRGYSAVVKPVAIWTFTVPADYGGLCPAFSYECIKQFRGAKSVTGIGILLGFYGVDQSAVRYAAHRSIMPDSLVANNVHVEEGGTSRGSANTRGIQYLEYGRTDWGRAGSPSGHILSTRVSPSRDGLTAAARWGEQQAEC